MISLNRQLLNDFAAAVDHVTSPVATVSSAQTVNDIIMPTVVGLTDAKFLRLIDDLVEMHPTGCGHRRGPLRAGPRDYGEVVIHGDVMLDQMLHLTMHDDGRSRMSTRL